MDRSGICVAGNMIVDITYPIERWPRQCELTHITDGITRTMGGAVCNTIVDLAVLDPSLRLKALGKVGEDPDGEWILSNMQQYPNIDISSVRREGITSFTSVMSEHETKKRTFFHYYGANAHFSEEDIDWEQIHSKILHIGYILLLNALDAEDAVFGTRMARLLCHARERGLKTSIDVVSECGDRFQNKVLPALKYTDYCVINELEASASTGIPLRGENDALLTENMPLALAALKKMGVSTWAVIHAAEGGFGMDERNAFHSTASLPLPPGYIKGTVGAGDAFCAGVLCAAYRGEGMPKAIELGTASAACSLSAVGATEGMRGAAEAMALYRSLRENG